MATKTTTSLPPEGRQIFHRTRIKREVLALLAEYFCLRTNDLAAFLYPNPTHANKSSTARTLRILMKQGYLNRLPYLDLDAQTGVRTYVYGLSDKGVQFIDSYIFAGNNCKTFDEHSARTLDHELEISFFHIALNRFCRSRGLQLYWRQKDLKRTIAPDAFFSIADATKPAGRDTLHYFLELERAKIGNYRDGEPSIMRKLGKYYEYFNTDLCQKEWKDFRKFRVVVIQRNDPKRQNLLKELEKKYSHRMFWLTTEELYKQDIGAEIFATPKDHAQRSYSFLSL